MNNAAVNFPVTGDTETYNEQRTKATKTLGHTPKGAELTNAVPEIQKDIPADDAACGKKFRPLLNNAVDKFHQGEAAQPKPDLFKPKQAVLPTMSYEQLLKEAYSLAGRAEKMAERAREKNANPDDVQSKVLLAGIHKAIEAAKLVSPKFAPTNTYAETHEGYVDLGQ